MALTLADVRAAVRVTMSDTAAWPDAMIDGWIGQALRLYSAHFPRRWRHTLDLVTGTQVYDLPGEHGLMGVVSVEYPAGQAPPRYLAQVAEWASRFQAGGRVYALRGVADTVLAGSDAAAGQIVFAETVATGEQAVIEYLGSHAIPAAGAHTAVIVMPPSHLEAITAYVFFAGQAELACD
jgi:hypothetical protein